MKVEGDNMANNETKKIKLMIVDDHPFFRQGVCLYFEPLDDIEVISQAESGQNALNLLSENNIDLILMDLQMSGMDGIETTKKIIENHPDIKVLVLTSFNNWDKVYQALTSGASGYILKDAQPEELIAAIRAVAAGGNYFGSQITGELMQRLTNTNKKESNNDGNKNDYQDPELIEPLTKREIDVLKLIGQGLSNRDIADELVLSEKTIKTHATNIYSKLQVNSRTQAAVYAMKHGIV